MRKLLFSLALLMLIWPSVCLADIGPKPSMEFSFTFENEAWTIVEGQQIQCQDPQCLDSSPLEDLGPQGFSCDENSCYSMAYGYTPYQMLEITFSNGQTWQSEIFEATDYHMNIEFLVSSDSMEIVNIKNESTTFLPVIGNMFLTFLLVLALTIGIEVLVAYFYFKSKQISLKFLKCVAVINLITLILFWFLFPIIFAFLLIFSLGFVIFSEILIVLIEAAFLNFRLKNNIKFGQALYLSFLMNLTSVICGSLLFWIILSIFLF